MMARRLEPFKSSPSSCSFSGSGGGTFVNVTVPAHVGATRAGSPIPAPAKCRSAPSPGYSRRRPPFQRDQLQNFSVRVGIGENVLLLFRLMPRAHQLVARQFADRLDRVAVNEMPRRPVSFIHKCVYSCAAVAAISLCRRPLNSTTSCVNRRRASCACWRNRTYASHPGGPPPTSNPRRTAAPSHRDNSARSCGHNSTRSRRASLKTSRASATSSRRRFIELADEPPVIGLDRTIARADGQAAD